VISLLHNWKQEIFERVRAMNKEQIHRNLTAITDDLKGVLEALSETNEPVHEGLSEEVITDITGEK
jgi:hypothetical protein